MNECTLGEDLAQSNLYISLSYCHCYYKRVAGMVQNRTSGNSVGFRVSTLGLQVEVQATVAFDKSLKLSEISSYLQL